MDKGKRIITRDLSRECIKQDAIPVDYTKVEKQVDQHTVELHTGGKVTLQVDIQLFELNKEDRDFVFDLIDRLRGYGERHQN